MPFTGNPATNPVDRVRLMVGDVFADFEILDDATYQYFLDKNQGDEQKAALDAARTIRFQIAKFSYRETTGDIEVWSNFAADYKAALDDLISEIVDGVTAVAIPYAGGISQIDMWMNKRDWDTVPLNLPRLSTCPYRHYWWNTDSKHPILWELDRDL